MENLNSQEPYRATKLWNEVILAFRTGMPLKKHRWRMRSYNDSFTASECISWLNCYLMNNVNFGPGVTRQQTTQLLQKFLKCNVIESICFRSKTVDFYDNSQLYRFVQYSPIKSKNRTSLQVLLRSPLSSYDVNNFENGCRSGKNNLLLKSSMEISSNVNTFSKLNQKKTVPHEEVKMNRIPECHFVSRNLSVGEIENIWKATVLRRLELAILPVKLQDLLNLKEINGRVIFHNVTRVSKTGVVTLIDKTDDIPHWVISAMKCLVNWPNASGSGSCLPNYPGFEKDVFKVVRDFFINSQISLVPSELFSLMVELCFPGKKKCIDMSCHTVYSDQPSDMSVTSEVVSNCQKTSTPLSLNPIVQSGKINVSVPIISKPCSSQSEEGKLLLDDPNAMWDFPSMCFETEFSNVNPVTRIVPNQSLVTCFPDAQLNLPSMSRTHAGSIDTMSTISACSQISQNLLTVHVQDQPQDFLQADNEEQFISAVEYCEGENSESGDEGIFDRTFKHSSFDDLKALENHSKTPKSVVLPGALTLPRKCRSQSKLSSFSSPMLNKDSNVRQTESVLPRVYFKSHEDICNVSSDNSATPLATPRSCNQMFERWEEHNIPRFSFCHSENEGCDYGIAHATQNYIHYLPSNSFSASKQNFPGVNEARDPEILSFYKGVENGEQRQKLLDVFQVLLLLLPPANRRQLHLLFRMINKVVKNNKLLFYSKMPLRKYFLETFLPAIVDLKDKTAAYQIAAFMLDECEVLFQIPASLKEDVEIRLAELRKGRIKYTLDDSCILTYCELVSRQQYEEQKVSVSKQALIDLLDGIVKDKSISEKEKKKKLKQFKSNHPEIYCLRFPSSKDLQETSKPKKALFTRFLNIRM